MIEAYDKNTWIITMEIWCWSTFPKHVRFHTKHKLTYSVIKFLIFIKVWFRQTYKNFKQLFTQQQRIQISLDLAETISRLLNSFMQVCIKVRYQQIPTCQKCWTLEKCWRALTVYGKACADVKIWWSEVKP